MWRKVVQTIFQEFSSMGKTKVRTIYQWGHTLVWVFYTIFRMEG